MFFRAWHWDWLPWSQKSSHRFGCLLRGSQGGVDSLTNEPFLFCTFFSTSFASHPGDSYFHCNRVSLCRYLLLPTSCLRVWGWFCYQDSFRISLCIHFHHSKEKLLPVAESSFQQNLFPKKKKKRVFWLVVWLFSLSKGGSSKIIFYILHSMVKGSTHCSCTLLVLSETISIPTFYLTSHLSSASNASA